MEGFSVSRESLKSMRTSVSFGVILHRSRFVQHSESPIINTGIKRSSSCTQKEAQDSNDPMGLAGISGNPHIGSSDSICGTPWGLGRPCTAEDLTAQAVRNTDRACSTRHIRDSNNSIHTGLHRMRLSKRRHKSKPLQGIFSCISPS
jgi:hypothetical protein